MAIILVFSHYHRWTVDSRCFPHRLARPRIPLCQSFESPGLDQRLDLVYFESPRIPFSFLRPLQTVSKTSRLAQSAAKLDVRRRPVSHLLLSINNGSPTIRPSENKAIRIMGLFKKLSSETACSSARFSHSHVFLLETLIQ